MLLLPLLLVVGCSCAASEEKEEVKSVCHATCDGASVEYSEERSCQCDALCVTYGDCCRDHPRYAPGRLSTCVKAGDWVTRKTYAENYYMVVSCPASWAGVNHTRLSCEKYLDTVKREPILGHPITSTATNITYANYHCAKCNGDLNARTMVRWKLSITCDRNLTLPVPHIDALLRDAVLERGLLVVTFSNASYHSCELYVWRPRYLLRKCVLKMVQTCPKKWNDASVRAQCEAYTEMVYRNERTPYRNPHCAACHGKKRKELSCSRVEVGEETIGKIFDFSGGGGTGVGETRICQHEDEAYDPRARKCRHILWAMAGQEDERNCSRFVLEPEEFSLNEDLSATDLLWGKALPAGSFSVRDDGRLLVCAGDFQVTRDKFGDGAMMYLSFLGLGVSVVCLVLHLCAFMVSPALRNLSGKNLASFCVALLVAYITFIIGEFLEVGGTTCKVVAVVMYYSFMASFTWLLLMAYDVWRTLRLSTVRLRVVSRESRRHVFLVYAVLAWLVLPGAFVCAALAVELLCEQTDLLRPRFGSNNCWFGARWSLAMFFAVPVGAIMALNALLYVSSAHMICSASVSQASKSCSSRRDYRLFVRLALLMGLSWLSGFVASYLDWVAAWYVYVLLNAFQGLFIFGAFTMTQKIRDGIRSQVSGESKSNYSMKGSSSSRKQKGLLTSAHTNTTT